MSQVDMQNVHQLLSCCEASQVDEYSALNYVTQVAHANGIELTPNDLAFAAEELLSQR